MPRSFARCARRMRHFRLSSNTYSHLLLISKVFSTNECECHNKFSHIDIFSMPNCMYCGMNTALMRGCREGDGMIVGIRRLLEKQIQTARINIVCSDRMEYTPVYISTWCGAARATHHHNKEVIFYYRNSRLFFLLLQFSLLLWFRLCLPQ